MTHLLHFITFVPVLERFKSNILKNNLFDKEDRLLLAFSGGVDSVALSELLMEAGYAFDMAHCNFKLRGEESDADEKFCRRYAKKIRAILHRKQFDTAAYAEEQNLSIQMAARELRYKWFKRLLNTYGYTHIITAHHLNDNIETLLVNLVRGTGIQGLQGIPEKQQNIVRPLLFASKDEIIAYAEEKKLDYRHDSSNDEVKYKRNFLRLNVIPELKKLNPSLESTFANNIRLFKQAAEVVSAFAEQKRREIVKEGNGIVSINTQKLLQLSARDLLLFECLKPYDFNADQCVQLMKSLQSGSKGKLFYSPTHKALIDRQSVLIEPLGKEAERPEYIITTLPDFEALPFRVEYNAGKSKDIKPGHHIAQLDLDKLKFPLIIRRWKRGDKFRPLGMNGFKKLSDFFINQKLTQFEKERTWVLCSGNNIAWVMGHRIDDRFKITDSTTSVLTLKYLT